MPTVFTHNGFRFYFFSQEGRPVREPIHVPVEGHGGACKIFVHTLRVVDVHGLSRPEVNELVQQVRQNQDKIVKAWYAHFGG